MAATDVHRKKKVKPADGNILATSACSATPPVTLHIIPADCLPAVPIRSDCDAAPTSVKQHSKKKRRDTEPVLTHRKKTRDTGPSILPPGTTKKRRQTVPDFAGTLHTPKSRRGTMPDLLSSSDISALSSRGEAGRLLPAGTGSQTSQLWESDDFRIPTDRSNRKPRKREKETDEQPPRRRSRRTEEKETDEQPRRKSKRAEVTGTKKEASGSRTSRKHRKKDDGTRTSRKHRKKDQSSLEQLKKGPKSTSSNTSDRTPTEFPKSKSTSLKKMTFYDESVFNNLLTRPAPPANPLGGDLHRPQTGSIGKLRDEVDDQLRGIPALDCLFQSESTVWNHQ